ncbi:hypothetical protein PIB30_058252 [Stylosanthes scabra]|uniref:Uncharacterized protein n=1 Tax=Stylosanthes scabra TaxID=79078 RepID=A0ABU6YKJ8_9FABA|nr:hypothetical protein [Stylosanthes scabra]
MVMMLPPLPWSSFPCHRRCMKLAAKRDGGSWRRSRKRRRVPLSPPLNAKDGVPEFSWPSSKLKEAIHGSS